MPDKELIGIRLTKDELRNLDRLIRKYSNWIRDEQPLASQIIDLVNRWVISDIEK